MSHRTRLRVSLEDGRALSDVVTAVADLGGTVLTADLHLDAHPVEDLVIDLPDEHESARLAELLSPTSVIVLTDGAASAPPDRLLHLLRALYDVATGPAADAERALVEVLADACPALAVWVDPLPRALCHPVAEDVVRQGRPLVRRTSQLPYGSHPQLPDEATLLAVADDRTNPTRIGFVVRAPEADFSATDVARAEAVLALAGPLLAAPRPDPEPATSAPMADLTDGAPPRAPARSPRRPPERLVVDERTLRTLGRYRLHRRYGVAAGHRSRVSRELTSPS